MQVLTIQFDNLEACHNNQQFYIYIIVVSDVIDQSVGLNKMCVYSISTLTIYVGAAVESLDDSQFFDGDPTSSWSSSR